MKTPTTRIHLCRLILTIASTLVAGESSAAYDHVHADQGDGGGVVCESVVASRVGRDVLRAGGNAVDAAVATSFALAVTWPEAGNLGGGGFMLIRPAEGDDSAVCIDYRETAPQKVASIATSVDIEHRHRSVGVPGTVRGLALAHERFGRLPWNDVVMPAARLAERGFAVDRFLARSINLVLRRPSVRGQQRYEELRRVFGKPDGEAWAAGDWLRLPDLAKTLETIARDGADVFYRGSIATQIIDEMERGRGVILPEDLGQYKAIARPAIHGTYRGYSILGAPPASSGGTCVIETLNILENFDLASGERYSTTTAHLIAEASRFAFADRARYLGDPQFKRIPDFLTTKQYAKSLANKIDPDSRASLGAIEDRPRPHESADTTHMSIVDADGMAVSNTTTLRHPWGSRIIVRDTGILLNNLLGGIDWPRPAIQSSDEPTSNKRTQSSTQGGWTFQPRQRLLSSQSPTIVTKDGKLVFVTGSPGGRTIISTVVGILINLIDFGMTPAEAIRSPRMHHQWKPDRIDLERIAFEPHWSLSPALTSLGHRVRSVRPQGSAHSIAVDADSGIMTGIADYRRGGRPAMIDSRVITRWDFDEPRDTALGNTSSRGRIQSDWIGKDVRFATNGIDGLRLVESRHDETVDIYINLKEAGYNTKKIAAEFKISDAYFIGMQRLESVRIGFVDDMKGPRVSARFVLAPSEEGIVLRGEAYGDGEKLDPIPICQSSRLGQPIIVRLELDGENERYTVGYRTASMTTMKATASGKTAPDRRANFLRIGVRRHLAANDEHVTIDRIEIQSLDRSSR